MTVAGFSKATALQWLKSAANTTGMKRPAVKIYSGYQRWRVSFKSRFDVSIDGSPVRFVTEDDRSKWFFHLRYNQGELHEPPVTLELAARVKNAKVFADVGAHIGYYACVAGAVNRDLSLVVLEMNHNLIEVIRRNLKENDLDRAEVINQPVSDRRKTISYPSSSTDPGLSMQADGQTTGNIEAETVALDEVFRSLGLAPDVIKMDVQGAEMDALRGAEETLREHHPVLFLEVHPKIVGDFGATVDRIYEFLEKHGYELHLINEHRGTGGRLLPSPAKGQRPTETHMLLCT